MPVQYLTGTPFDKWDTTTVAAAVGKQLDAKAKQALLFYEGDHWQNKAGWAGPIPDPLTTGQADATKFMEKVHAAFTSSNVLAEVVDRHVSAVFGRPPGWQFLPIKAKEGDEEQPDEEKDPLVVEAEAGLTDWMDRRNAHQFLLEAMADYATCGHGMVRLFIPPGLLEGDGNGGKRVPSGLTEQEALDMIFIEKIGPEASGAAWDRSTMAEAAFTSWDESIQEGSGTTQRKHTEIQFTEIAGKKRMTKVRTWQLTTQTGDLTLDLGGLLLMHPIIGRPLVSDQIMQLQKGLNFALTAMGRNNANAGFLERIILNAQPPGSYETGADGKQTFVPGPYKGGPGASTFLMGQPISDENGNVVGYTNPGVSYRDPSSPEAFKASLEEYRGAMYMEAKQGHLLTSGDGNASGASRVHLRADFEVSLRDTRVAAEDTYRWLLMVVARLAAVLSGKPGRYDSLRVAVQANVNTGPLTDAERAAIQSQYEKGLRSREGAMVLLGVDDPDAEFLRIQNEKPTNPVGLDTLALLGITLLPAWQAELCKRAGIDVTDDQLAKMEADAEAMAQLQMAASKARSRSLLPEDVPPAPDGEIG